MLEYGRFDHGRMKPGLGDWKARSSPARCRPPSRRRRSRRSIRRCTSCASPGATSPAPAAQPALSGAARRSPSSSRSTTRAATSTTASARLLDQSLPRGRVRGDLRRRRLDRRDAGAARRARRRARARARRAHPQLGLARPAAQRRRSSCARGEFVYFVDNDDWLGHEALERMHAMAVRDEADIVIGKVVGHGKSVPRNLFRRNRTGVDLEWEPLVWLLTPHKLWRRAFLDAHGAALPRGQPAARGPRVRDARVLRRAADLGAGRLPLLPLGAARPRRPTRRGGTSTRSPTSRSCARCSTSSTSTPSRARSATACTRAGTAARCSTGSRGCTPTPTLRAAARSTRRCTSWRSSASPPGVDAFLPFNLQQRSRLLRAGDYEGWRRSPTSRPRCARRRARSPCGRSRAAPS